ncbi:ROK family transcriptional regulator [Nocardioides bizhenqiangii]|uniref:ROK family transcriptional regulator n=1 Tax=Nocardioides bizhenqiangii TaxID=3095076 RepID=A0ABZ0ZTM1_9ACTN|nr:MULTISPECIES: ROK family transcriptional regulator [unclassified Nocardioides]MDZ5622067.1 ROK family transcriptional regulator [Nocardioides sp. HM23]WQQ27261.1 ROK family transcriptional regulator [Nocardioides sp. HM61]
MRPSDIFDLLRDGQPRTRAQLVEATGLARSTISARLDALMRLGLVVPFGGVSTGGRPPSLLAFNPGARVVVGVDLGATHATAAIADLDGRILAERSVQLDIALGPERVLGWVDDVVRELLADQGRDVAELAAIGIGLPGPVEHSTGRAINPPIMPGWDRYDVPGHVQRAFAVPVLVDNDVNIMALGEQHAHLREVSDLVFIKVGTGIGAGIISGGTLQRGAQGTAGDLGHVHLPRAAHVTCRCGNQGCLEAIAAVPALAAAVRSAGVELAHDHDVVALVRGGDQQAIQVVRQSGRDLGEVLATLVNLVNPSVIVIGGGLAAAGEGLLAGIREVVYQRSLPLATEHLRIVTSRAGERAGVIGAAALAIGHVLAPESIDRAVERAATAEMSGVSAG